MNIAFDHVVRITLLLLFLAVRPAQTQAQPSTGWQAPFTPKAPPPAPPIETGSGPIKVGPRPLGPSPTLYSIGQPTDEEQLYLEYINRSRADPTAEGARLAATTDPDVVSAYNYFHVNLPLMQQEFATNPPVPPLAMNAKLLTAARLHSGDMFTNNYQGHNGTDGSTIGTRAQAQGYLYSSIGENVFAFAESVFYGHAGLNVDWGTNAPSVGGMQNPPGHRNNIHSSTFREIGVGVVDGSNGSVGPQIVTQDFGVQQAATPLLSGVVYYDFNGNNFYDVGEGIGGVTVDVTGANYYAVTAISGGYTVPVPGNGNYTLTFSAQGLATTQRVATVSGTANVKVDYVPAYSPPVVSGPNPASINQSNTYTFTPVGAATNYQWSSVQLTAFTTVEGGENGLGNVTVVSSPSYSVLATDSKASGSFSFHLGHPMSDPPTSQFVTLNPMLLLGANSQLTFAKRLALASPDEVAKAQISTDGGSSWQDLWSQAGDDTNGDANFIRITNSLAAYAGLVAQIRFVFAFSSGSYWYYGSGVGFYFDDVAISHADQVSSEVVNGAPNGISFAFYPTVATDYLLRVRAQLPGRTLEWGPALRVTAATAPPSIQLLSSAALAGNQIQIDFTVANYQAGMTFQLLKASDVGGAYGLDGSASFQTLIANSKFRATTSTGGAERMFYKIKGSY